MKQEFAATCHRRLEIVWYLQLTLLGFYWEWTVERWRSSFSYVPLLTSLSDILVKIAGLLAELIAGIVLVTRNAATETAIFLAVLVFFLGVVEGVISLMRIMA